jgi:Ca2+-binding EF-hand superfamily protein
LYARFIFLFFKPLSDKDQEKFGKELGKNYKKVETYQVPIDSIRDLQEFKFHPFTDRIVQIFKEDVKNEQINLEQFITILGVFGCQTNPENKKRMLFRIYDRQNRNGIPLLDIRNIFAEQIFVRTHYSEINPNVQVRSSYSDRVMRQIMEEIVMKYD